MVTIVFVDEKIAQPLIRSVIITIACPGFGDFCRPPYFLFCIFLKFHAYEPSRCRHCVLIARLVERTTFLTSSE